MLFSTSSLSLLATPAFGQTLNAWRQRVFDGCCGIPDHEVAQAVDGNVTTYNEVDTLPNRLGLLFNSPDVYLGFYIQSSGAYITDYYVTCVESITVRDIIVGEVSNATSNFTLVEFFNSDGTAGVETDTIFLEITAVSDGGSTAITNGIYPIYRGDTIVYPSGQSAQASPTQTNIPPTSTAVVIPSPTISGVTLNPWPTTSAGEPLPQGEPYNDRNLSTTYNTSRYLFLFNRLTTYEGFYVLSKSPNYLTNYHVVAQNPTTYVNYEVCRVRNAASNFTLCAFIDEEGYPGYWTDIIYIYPDASLNGADPEINEVYPIWPGDYIKDPNV